MQKLKNPLNMRSYFILILWPLVFFCKQAHSAISAPEGFPLVLNVGDYIFTVENSIHRKGVRITSLEGKKIFSTLMTSNFIHAFHKLGKIDGRFGAFKFKELRTFKTCNRNQTIDQVDVSGESIQIKGIVSGHRCSFPYELTFKVGRTDSSTSYIDFELNADGGANRLKLLYQADRDEGIFGLGEQFTYINLKGKKVPIMAQEQGHLRGAMPLVSTAMNTMSPGSAGDWHTTYTGIPFYFNNKGNALYLNNLQYLKFDFSKNNESSVYVWSDEISGRMFDGINPKEIVRKFTEFSGRPRVLPDWIHKGVIVGIMGGSDYFAKVDNIVQTAKIPVSAYWLQDWVGSRTFDYGTRLWWNWLPSPGTYPNWEQIRTNLESRSIKLMGYVNPYLTDTKNESDHIENMYEHALGKNYFMRDSDGNLIEVDSVKFFGTFLDFSNPDVSSWIRDHLKQQVLNLGLTGWMADFGEAMSFSAKPFYSPTDPHSYHQYFLKVWAKFNREFAEMIDQIRGRDNEFVYMARSAVIGTNQFTDLYWLGDQVPTWDDRDGLKSSINGLISGGLSGLAINHSDIGGAVVLKIAPGVVTRRTPELYKRWTEANTFTSILRTHASTNAEYAHEFYDSNTTLSHFSKFSKIYSFLYDYRKLLFVEAHKSGVPVVRHLMLEFPDDIEAYKNNYQFMLGANILVAPVVDKGNVRRRVYLPKGDWEHLFEAQSVKSEGQYFNFEAPLGKPPVFFKKSFKEGFEIREKILKLD